MSTSSPAETLSPSRPLSATRRWSWFLAFGIPAFLLPIWPAIGSEAFSGHILSTRSGLVLSLMLGAAATTDSLGKKIYNWTTYPAFLFAILLNFIASYTGSAPSFMGEGSIPTSEIGLSACLLGAVACFVPMFMIRNATGGGAGDVKLATSIGALLGAACGIKIIVFCYITGGAFALAMLVWNNGPLTVTSLLTRRVASRFFPGYVLPPNEEQKLIMQGRMALGPFFALATVLVLSGMDDSWLFAF